MRTYSPTVVVKSLTSEEAELFTSLSAVIKKLWEKSDSTEQ